MGYTPRRGCVPFRPAGCGLPRSVRADHPQLAGHGPPIRGEVRGVLPHPSRTAGPSQAPVRAESAGLADIAAAEVRGPDAPAQPAESHLVTELLYLIERLQADYRAADARHEQTVMELSGRIGYLQAELQQTREQLALAAREMAPPVHCAG